MLKHHSMYRKVPKPCSENDIQVDDMYFSPIVLEETSLQALMESLKQWQLYRRHALYHNSLYPDDCCDLYGADTFEIETVVKKSLSKGFYGIWCYDFFIVLNEDDQFDGLLLGDPISKRIVQFHFVSPFYPAYHCFAWENQEELDIESTSEYEYIEIVSRSSFSTDTTTDNTK